MPLCIQTKDIEEAVGMVTGVPRTHIRHKKRRADIMQARHLSIYYHAQQEPDLKKVAEIWRLNYGTIKHSIKTVEQRRDSDFEFARVCRRIESILN